MQRQGSFELSLCVPPTLPTIQLTNNTRSRSKEQLSVQITDLQEDAINSQLINAVHMIILFQQLGRLNTLPLSAVGRKRPPTNIKCNPPHQHMQI
jgi:hypothetical protein